MAVCQPTNLPNDGEVIVSTDPKKSRHDAAVDMTFPASDPVAPGDATATEEPRRPAGRKAPVITREQIEQAQHAGGRKRPAVSGEPVDQPSAQTVRVRQGTGPRATVSVLFVSLLAAIVMGALLLGYWVSSG
jgi:hypothetical protein